MPTAPHSPLHYSIELIRAEARYLVQHNLVGRHQPIYTLCQYIPAQEWLAVEAELERHDYLLRDQIIDLLGNEEWDND